MHVDGQAGDHDRIDVGGMPVRRAGIGALGTQLLGSGPQQPTCAREGVADALPLLRVSQDPGGQDAGNGRGGVDLPVGLFGLGVA